MKITWTDRPDGRQFWQYNTQNEKWVKTVFVAWADLKKPGYEPRIHKILEDRAINGA